MLSNLEVGARSVLLLAKAEYFIRTEFLWPLIGWKVQTVWHLHPDNAVLCCGMMDGKAGNIYEPKNQDRRWPCFHTANWFTPVRPNSFDLILCYVLGQDLTMFPWLAHHIEQVALNSERYAQLCLLGAGVTTSASMAYLHLPLGGQY